MSSAICFNLDQSAILLSGKWATFDHVIEALDISWKLHANMLFLYLSL